MSVAEGDRVKIKAVAARIVGTFDRYRHLDPVEEESEATPFVRTEARPGVRYHHRTGRRDGNRYQNWSLHPFLHAGDEWPGVAIPYEDCPPTKRFLKRPDGVLPELDPSPKGGVPQIRIRRLPTNQTGIVIGRVKRMEGTVCPGGGFGEDYVDGALDVTRVVPLFEVAVLSPNLGGQAAIHLVWGADLEPVG